MKKSRRPEVRLVSVLLLSLLCLVPWAGAVPDSISIQGVLADGVGEPLTGTRAYEVQYYDAAADGNPLGDALTGSVTVGVSGEWAIVLSPPAAVVNAAGEVWYSLAIDSAAVPDGAIDGEDVFSERIQVGSVYFAQRAGDADALGGADAATYATGAELSSGLAGKADTGHNHDSLYYTESEIDTSLAGKANSTHAHVASDISTGTLSTDRFSAYVDLEAEGAIGAGAGQVAAGIHDHDGAYVRPGEADSVTSAMIADGTVTQADLADEAALYEILDDDGPDSGLDADLLDGIQGSDYRDASHLNAGTLSTDRFSAYDDLETESKIGMEGDQLAPGDHNAHGYSSASGFLAAAGGGDGNAASGGYATVGGGQDNTASATRSTVGGGDHNVVRDSYGTIAGGHFNEVGMDDANANSQRYGTVGGGSYNDALGEYATVPGGSHNQASGEYSFAAGYSATASHDKSFVWNGTVSTTTASSRTGQFRIAAQGGVYIEDKGYSSGLNPAALEVAPTGTSAVAIHADQNSSDCAVVISNSGSGDLIKAYSASGNLRFKVSNSGTVTADGAFTGGGADFAEYLPQRDPAEVLEPGDVVGLFPDGLSKVTAGAGRILVVTTRPLVLGNAPGGEAPANHVAVAMLGQVPVKVAGPVRTGDCLVASGDDGAAVAIAPAQLGVNDYARMVGTALESSTQDTVKSVRASIGLANDTLLARAIEQRDARIAALERDLAVLQAAVTELAAAAR